MSVYMKLQRNNQPEIKRPEPVEYRTQANQLIVFVVIQFYWRLVFIRFDDQQITA